ncbi:maleylpyruvate isomerase family mycothiol-dependent enzyme [Paeniglutamicibacter sp. ABSL32-1]|uniref:maleylpyruvate isomerase family mycothiol-dependent enzyme n=1 Tax=Paeniglutamicibacter quisquiliarum TaxID=2849498 RepID=UPI001C2DE6DE|nr:maleylpyruvate isomerase family mycothiol-dependent enzyme [Paeniglutamicibacter quisquiliarum]MBV1778572.1 maleylpyruvate isomerase family mycothiol-dependent enzyme [Paeniglutamicibacter quisquiliarum]
MTPRRNFDVWPVVHAERLALLKDLEGLEPGQWKTPSLCPGWDVHDVLAHLTDTAKTTRLGFMRRLVLAGFDFDKDNAAGVTAQRRQDPAETLAGFRDVLTRTSTPPAAPATRLVEAFVHGEDIRRPLGMQGDYPAAQVSTALAHQVRTSVKMGGGKELAAGFTLVATDAAFEHGAGNEVRGPAITLLLAVSGRPVGEGELTGPGAATFVQRARC